jgi:hypothetical protein
MYECLTGRLPFDLGNETDVMMAHLQTDPPPPSAVKRDLPPGVDGVVQRAMAKKLKDRFSTCTEFVAAFREELNFMAEPKKEESQGTVVAAGGGAGQQNEQAPAGGTVVTPGGAAPQGAEAPAGGTVVAPGGPQQQPQPVAQQGGGGWQGQQQPPPGGGGGPTRPGWQPPPGGPTRPGWQPPPGGGGAGPPGGPGGPGPGGPGGPGWQQGPPPSGGGGNRGLIIGIIVGVVVILLAVLGFFLFAGGDDENDVADDASPSPAPSATASVSASPSAAPSVSAEPSPVEEGFPAAGDEEFIFKHIPLDIQPTCEREQPDLMPDNASAGIACSPSGAADFISYYKFPTAPTMNRSYNLDISIANTTKDNGGSCAGGPLPAETTYTRGEKAITVGRILCFNFQGTARISWTNNKLIIYSQAGNLNGNMNALNQFWTTAGPTSLPNRS